MIEAAENDTPRDSDESQNSEALPKLTLNVSIASAQKTDSDILEKNVRSQTNATATDHSKCCASDSHKGSGKRGQDLDFIEANYLKVNVDTVVERVFRYSVEIRMDGPKKFHTKVFMKFCTDFLPKQAKQIAFDDDKMIALSPCKLDMGKGNRIQRKFQFALPQIENDWKQSKKSKNHQLNKRWFCEVTMKPANYKFTIPLKRVLAG